MRKRNQNFVKEKSAVPLEKKSRKNLDKTRHESDNEEAELELFLFGEKKEKLIEECNSPDKISSISNNNEESSDLLAFTISTTPDVPSDKMSLNDQYQESFPIQLNKKKELKPAWVDEDDKEVCISLDIKSLKRYKKSANEDQVNGLKYQERLKSHFEKVQPVPLWAELNDEHFLGNEESNDDDYLSNSSRSLLKKSEKLSKGFIDIVRVKDLNSTQPSNACITSLQFHPTAKIAFTSSLNKRLNMFQVDGRENASLQSIFIDHFPIYCARFISNGNRIALSSRRKFFYNYDLNSGQVLKIPELRGREDLSLENFEVSPDGEIIAFLGESGYINMVSSKTSQYMYSLKMNGKVLSAAFSSDSSKLYTTGRDGQVYVWDLKSRRCQQKFVDDGSTKSTSLSVSNNGAYIAVGSNSGVVNVYNGTGSIERNPSPLKAVLNLTTKIDRILFNSTSEILTFSSPQSRNALRMVHLPSLTTFSNWPTEKQTLGRISCMNFSPLSGYFGIGNEMGKALLFSFRNLLPRLQQSSVLKVSGTCDRGFNCLLFLGPVTLNRSMVANHSIQNTDEDDVEFYEGEHNKNGQRHGRGTLFLNSKRTVKFHGKFQHDLKEGRGCFYFADGSSLSGMFKDDCLNGVGVYTYDDGSTMVGTYSDGMLHGSCEEFNVSGQLTFKGNYLNNMRIGVCQFFLEFGGTLFGRVNKLGKLSGKNTVYAYPDNKTFLKGQFEDGELVCAYPAVYSGVGDKFNPFSYKTIRGEKITKDVSTSFIISKSPLDEDIFESSRVEVKQSSNKNAGEGLFSCVHAQPGEVMSFYNGVRLTHKEVDERDWLYNDNTISLDEEVVIDVPKPWSDLKFYKASLGHKANHSFKPNCMYDRFNHPRFGKIKCIRTISFVQPGDELFVEYGYDHLKLDTDAPLWYQKALVEHLNNKDKKV